MGAPDKQIVTLRLIRIVFVRLCVVIYEETTYSTSALTATGVKMSQLEEHIKLLNETDGFKQQFAVSSIRYRTAISRCKLIAHLCINLPSPALSSEHVYNSTKLKVKL